MKRLTMLLIAAFALGVQTVRSNPATADYNIIPMPQSIIPGLGEGFVVSHSTVIAYPAGNKDLERVAGMLSQYIEVATGLKLETTPKAKAKNAIQLDCTLSHANSEAYNLTIGKKGITINGASPAGTFYGVQTLRKSLPLSVSDNMVVMPAVSISDWPRFGYRGMHLDVSRHMFPVEFVKKYIDLLALHNINRLHWHITDDQGWRIEIDKYPLLTEVGGFRNETLIGHYNDKPRTYDGKRYGGFYTKDEARQIVQYAADRFISVIPEVDLPGHMSAALTAYPWLGCTGGPYQVEGLWGIFDEVLCLGKESTYSFLNDVFAEIIDIFPSQYIHIGGDECPRKRWKECPLCQAKIKELGLAADQKHSAEDKLQTYSMTCVEKFLNDHGRRIIGWDEILEGNIAPNATVMSWRGVEGGIAAAQLGHDAIMVPNKIMYFNYYQSEDKKSEPLAIGGYIPLDMVYAYEPIPDVLTEEQKKHIIGAQANLWCEYIKDGDLVEYMVLPRMDALSEVQWTMPAAKDYASFLKRLERMVKLYDRTGYKYATHGLR